MSGASVSDTFALYMHLNYNTQTEMKYRKLLVPEPNTVEMIWVEEDLAIETPNEVIVRNHFSHISAGTELACLAGIESWFSIPGTPGYTSVGEVVAKGDGVSHVAVGDLVYTYGPHQEIFKFDATDRWHGVCVKVPDGLAGDIAAFTHMAGIAFTSVRASSIELGDYVLVTGLGAIGNLAAQLARLQGGVVIATDIDNQRLEAARQCGITHLINSSESDWVEQVKALTGGVGVSTIIDASGLSAVVSQAADAGALNSEMILLGTPRAPFNTNVTEFLQHFHLLPFCMSLKGALEFTIPTHQNDFSKHSIERNASIIMELFRDGKLNVAPFYTHKLAPSEAPRAYEGLRTSKNEYIGVVFDWKS